MYHVRVVLHICKYFCAYVVRCCHRMFRGETKSVVDYQEQMKMAYFRLLKHAASYFSLSTQWHNLLSRRSIRLHFRSSPPYIHELHVHPDYFSFNVVGYGCMTCIGNSGPLPEPVSEAIEKVIICLFRWLSFVFSHLDMVRKSTGSKTVMDGLI